jgi:hypothetical protein
MGYLFVLCINEIGGGGGGGGFFATPFKFFFFIFWAISHFDWPITKKKKKTMENSLK